MGFEISIAITRSFWRRWRHGSPPTNRRAKQTRCGLLLKVLSVPDKIPHETTTDAAHGSRRARVIDIHDRDCA
jgi:hypothetical protein